MPYIIIPDNQMETGLVLGISIYSMAQTFAQSIKDTAYLVAEFIAAIGVGAGIIAAGIKAAAQLAYTVALAIALASLIGRFKQLLFPNIRYLNGCSAKNLIEKGCNYLGFTLSSTLLNSLVKVVILPVPLRKDKLIIGDPKNYFLLTKTGENRAAEVAKALRQGKLL